MRGIVQRLDERDFVDLTLPCLCVNHVVTSFYTAQGLAKKEPRKNIDCEEVEISPHVHGRFRFRSMLDLCDQSRYCIRDDRLQICDGLLSELMGEGLPFSLMLSFDSCISHVSGPPSTAIIPSVPQHACTITIYVLQSLRIRDGNMIWRCSDMRSELLVGFVYGKIVFVLPLLVDRP